MNTPAKKTRWALITGCSSGIGRCFAEDLAAKGFNLVLVARRKEKLESLGQALREKHGILTKVIPKDLAALGAAAELYQEVRTADISVDLLINNAGFGEYGILHGAGPESHRQMLLLNVVSLADLTRLFLEPMVERGSGTIVNVASTAAFQPLPYMATYGASKAFVLNFTEALWGEYHNRGIRFLAVCPGATDTEFFDRHSSPDAAVVGSKESPETVVRQTFEALDRGIPSVITGSFKNRFLANLSRFLSRRQTIMTAAGIMKPKLIRAA